MIFYNFVSWAYIYFSQKHVFFVSFICEYTSRSRTDKSGILGKLGKHQSLSWKPCAGYESRCGYLKPSVWEIYDSKTVISTLQISALLDYYKNCFRRIFKGIKNNKSYIYFF